MFKGYRIRRAHTKFLESCRNLREGRDYWSGAGPFKRWLLQVVIPLPLMGLHEDSMGLHAALEWLESNCRTRALDQEAIRAYHALAMGKKAPGSGQYRTTKVFLVGSKIQRPAPEKVSLLMRQLEITLSTRQKDLDGQSPAPESEVLALAVLVHEQVGMIHPFADGNGRVARLAMNHVLRRYGVGYVVFPPLDESPELMQSLQEAHLGNPGALVDLAREHLISV